MSGIIQKTIERTLKQLDKNKRKLKHSKSQKDRERAEGEVNRLQSKFLRLKQQKQFNELLKFKGS